MAAIRRAAAPVLGAARREDGGLGLRNSKCDAAVFSFVVALGFRRLALGFNLEGIGGSVAVAVEIRIAG